MDFVGGNDKGRSSQENWEFEGKYKTVAKCGSHNLTCVKREPKTLESLHITDVVEPIDKMFYWCPRDFGNGIPKHMSWKHGDVV